MSNKALWKRVGVGVAKGLLVALFTGAVIVAPGGVSGTLQVLEKLFEGKTVPDYKSDQIKRALRYLKAKRLIEIQKAYQKEVFALTKLGKRRARKLAWQFGIPRPKKWDRKWRLVVFDIPLGKKSAAEIFRYQLRQLGLANLQKSIWVHPYDCRDQVYYLAGQLMIKPYVRYIVAESITGEADLKSRFDIAA